LTCQSNSQNHVYQENDKSIVDTTVRLGMYFRRKLYFIKMYWLGLFKKIKIAFTSVQTCLKGFKCSKVLSWTKILARSSGVEPPKSAILTHFWDVNNPTTSQRYPKSLNLGLTLGCWSSAETLYGCSHLKNELKLHFLMV